MEITSKQNIKFLKILARLIGSFWLVIGIMYLIGKEFSLAIIQIISGAFFILLPNIISKISKFLKSGEQNEEKIKALSGKAMINLVKKVLENTRILDKRIQELDKTLYENPEIEKPAELPSVWKDFSDLELMSLPEATAIAVIDWYYCNRANGLDDEKNFKKIITIRKFFQKINSNKEGIKKLNQALEKHSQSLIEFIKAVVEAEHKVFLSSQNIEQLISEYKRTRKVI